MSKIVNAIKHAGKAVKAIDTAAGVVTQGVIDSVKHTGKAIGSYKTMKAAQAAGRTDDYNKAKSQFWESIYRLHPIGMTQSMAERIIDGIKYILGNHKEWYLNYDAGNMINANYGVNKNIASDVVYSNSSISPVHAVRLLTNLVIPKTQADEWRQGIQIMYNNLRSANAGAINYSMYDLERYVHCVRILHAVYCHLRRAFAVIRNVSRYDSSTPASYFCALGLDYNTFVANAANLKMFGNRFSVMISNLFPLDINLIDRTDWLFSNFFADSDDAKYTPYVFTPYIRINYYLPGDTTKYNLSITSTNISGTATGMNYTTCINNIQTFLNTCASNPVFNVIAGDILKAYGGEAIYPTEIWPDNMEVPVVHDEAALCQIQNCTICDVEDSNAAVPAASWVAPTYDTVLDPNFRPYPATRSQMGILNTYKDSMDPGDTLSISRLACAFEYQAGTNNNNKYVIRTCGTEIVTACGFIYTDKSNSSFGHLDVVTMRSEVNTTIGNIKLLAWSQVAYAPALFWQDSSNNVQTLFDLNNFAQVSELNLSAYHGYATLSLIATKRLAKLSKTVLIK